MKEIHIEGRQEGWQHLKTYDQDPYTYLVRLYRNGWCGRIIAAPDRSITYTLRDRFQRERAHGQAGGLEEAQAACDSVWQQSLN